MEVIARTCLLKTSDVDLTHGRQKSTLLHLFTDLFRKEFSSPLGIISRLILSFNYLEE